MDLQNRYRGASVGQGIGDAIWAPFETNQSFAVADRIRYMGGLRFFDYSNPWPGDGNPDLLPAGRPTDDSDQAADLASSIIACSTLDPAHLRAALRESVVHGKSRLWDGKATGAGKTTRKALSNDPVQQAEAWQNSIATNGSLMRSAPMALWFGPSTKNDNSRDAKYRSLVEAMSRVTHAHTDSISVCWLYIRMLRNALAARNILDVQVCSQLDERVLTYCIAHKSGKIYLPPDPGSFKNGWGAAEYTLKVALHGILTTTSFRDCIKTVGLAGGDTDTYGAVAGGLAGAIYGYEAIPKEWCDALLGHKYMVWYADQLFNMRMNR